MNDLFLIIYVYLENYYFIEYLIINLLSTIIDLVVNYFKI